MNVLEASSGSEATLRQNAVHLMVLIQILLDIGQVERGDRRAVLLQRHAPTARIALGPPKSPTTGTTRFLDSRAFEKSEAGFGGEIAAVGLPAPSVCVISSA